MATNVQFKQDWSNDGFLQITGAETLGRYHELLNKQSNIPINEYGVFFAFSDKQFEEGYKGLVKQGFIKDGERIKRFGNGAFGILEGMKRWIREAEAIDEQIRQECDPFEVYLDEYNNYECCIDWDGDDRAVEKVLSIYGLEVTTAALTGRRMRSHHTINDIYNGTKDDN